MARKKKRQESEAEELTPPEPEMRPAGPVGFVLRLKALITDIFMIYLPLLYIITYVVLGSKEAFQESFWGPFSAVLLYGIIDALFWWKNGQSPGKKMFELKIVDCETQKTLSFPRAFLRFVAFLFSATILIGVLLPLFRKDKKTLHDLVTRSCVVHA